VTARHALGRRPDRAAERGELTVDAAVALSTVICTPRSLAQDVGLGLGAQAGQRRLAAVLREAGFTHVRRATETLSVPRIMSPGLTCRFDASSLGVTARR
jgi:hypothetical protein